MMILYVFMIRLLPRKSSLLHQLIEALILLFYGITFPPMQLCMLVLCWFLDEIASSLWNLQLVSAYACCPSRSLKTIHSKKYGVDQICFTHHTSSVIYSSKKGGDGKVIVIHLMFTAINVANLVRTTVNCGECLLRWRCRLGILQSLCDIYRCMIIDICATSKGIVTGHYLNLAILSCDLVFCRISFVHLLCFNGGHGLF